MRTSTDADQMRHRCGTDAAQMRHRCGTDAAQMRHRCGLLQIYYNSVIGKILPQFLLTVLVFKEYATLKFRANQFQIAINSSGTINNPLDQEPEGNFVSQQINLYRF